jgi:hypothetical protein
MSRIFGSPAQLGYVVRDVQVAMDAWLTHGVGPWFYFANVEPNDFRHRGVASSLRMSVAIANSGHLQVELIEQLGDAPSLYKEFLDSGHEGFQHISYWTTDYQTLYDKALSAGYVVGHEGSIGSDHGRFAYLENDRALGTDTLVEISDVTGPKGTFFEHVREAAAGWDGSQPIRQFT